MFRESGKVGTLIPTVFIFGAGASKDAGIPLANEILPKIILQHSESLGEHAIRVKDFLRDLRWSHKGGKDHLPTFEEVLSFLDLAVVNGEVFSKTFQKLEKIRDSFIHCLESLIESERMKNETNTSHYKKLISLFCPNELPYATFITLNYDTLLDEALIGARSVAGHDEYTGADYCLVTHSGRFSLFGNDKKLLENFKLYDFAHSKSPVKLLKLHGSINWGFCPRCRMMVGPYRGAFSINLNGVEKRCPDHGIPLQTLIVPPSWNKNYRVHSIQTVWEMARLKLIEAERVVFIGYSLPEADQEVRYLLKVGLFREDEPPPFIYVVDKEGGDEDTEKRYRRFFNELEYQVIGFRGYLEGLKQTSDKTGVLGLTEEENKKFKSSSSNASRKEQKPAFENSQIR